MKFLFKVIFIIAVYGAGFYTGVNYEGSGDAVEDTLDHLQDLKTKSIKHGSEGIKQGKELLKKLKEE